MTEGPANQFAEGIDVSSNQGQVDWPAVKRAGKAFGFARATIGGHQLDSQFATNWQRMRDAGIIRGAYHFFWPLTPWQDQVELFTKTVGALDPGDLPPALDLEEAISRGKTVSEELDAMPAGLNNLKHIVLLLVESDDVF